MKALFVIITLLVFCSQIHSQPGSLDISFGDSGKVISTTYGGLAYSSLLQPDGKIVVGGNYGYYYKADNFITGSLLARYDTDGSLDYSFADSGRGVYNLGDPKFAKTIRGIALQKDGKIVAAGQYLYEYSQVYAMRLNADGTVDNSYGEGGIAILPNNRNFYLTRDMALLPDGRTVVTGDVQNGDDNDNNRSFLACFTADGKPDNNFGTGGIVIIELEDAMDINAIAITKEGKIVMGGDYFFGGKTFLLRYNSDGTPDNSFGLNALAEMPFDRSVANPAVTDIVIAGDNTVAVSGYVYLNFNYPNASMMVSRFLENGTPDSSFGTNGYTITSNEEGESKANSVAVQPDGRIVIGGNFSTSEVGGIAAARYDKDGVIDSSFGVNGMSETVFTGDDVQSSLLIQRDGKIVLSGYTLVYYSLGYRYIVELARYNNDESKRQIIATRIKRWIQHHGISWQMDNNVRYYNVQRSNDGGVTYQPVAKIYNNHQLQYNYEDAAGKSNDLYRVAAVGKDGSRSYSNSILLTSESSVSVFPNPVRSTTQLQGLSADSKTNISIVDFTSNVRTTATANGSSCSINTSNLKPGNYFIRIETNKTITTQPFVKE